VTYRRDSLREIEAWGEKTYPDVWSQVTQEMNRQALEAEVGEGDIVPWEHPNDANVRSVFDEGLADRIREKWVR
jgi:hypothetical protein